MCDVGTPTAFYADTEPWIAAQVHAPSNGDPRTDALLLEEFLPACVAVRSTRRCWWCTASTYTNAPLSQSLAVQAALYRAGAATELLQIPARVTSGK
ncbi:hypothetical protein HBB16_04235 [Pseudonocardia sp. MCCB 268]|nr:hypothetical protein [Pseudonocardia cytotoxica]